MFVIKATTHLHKTTFSHPLNTEVQFFRGLGHASFVPPGLRSSSSASLATTSEFSSSRLALKEPSSTFSINRVIAIELLKIIV